MAPLVGNGVGGEFRVSTLYANYVGGTINFYATAKCSNAGTGVYKVFDFPDSFSSGDGDHITMRSTHDSVNNYTFMSVNQNLLNNFVYILAEWQLGNPMPSPTTIASYYNVMLDNPDDDLIFQQFGTFTGFGNALSNSTGRAYITSTSDGFLFYFTDNSPQVSGVGFLFNPSMTEYTRFDIVTDGALSVGNFFIDTAGNYWLQGYDPVNYTMATQYLPAGGGTPVTIFFRRRFTVN